ncbi:hypothetical protein [Okeania sp. SIO3B5]|nr:hypothetical protein [Okeania sp. SIO3B5]
MSASFLEVTTSTEMAKLRRYSYECLISRGNNIYRDGKTKTL